MMNKCGCVILLLNKKQTVEPRYNEDFACMKSTML